MLTENQMKNRIKIAKFKKWLWKELNDDVLAPFIGGLIFLTVVILATFKLHGVI